MSKMKKEVPETQGALSSDEMRALEKAAFESGAKDSLELMEVAGSGVAIAISDYLEAQSGPAWDVVILCGPGNNGGDGFVIARRLAARGIKVRVLFYGRADALSEDARRNHDRWMESHSTDMCQLGFPEVSPEGEEVLANTFATDNPLLVVDALFGIGLTRPLEGLRGLIGRYAARRSRAGGPQTFCVAVDVPSGLADNGPLPNAEDLVLAADLTVTFHRRKKAHLAAPELCGTVVVHDIGL